MQLAGIDSQRQLRLWISQYFEIKVLTLIIYNYFLVLETSFTIYLFLWSAISHAHGEMQKFQAFFEIQQIPLMLLTQVTANNST